MKYYVILKLYNEIKIGTNLKNTAIFAFENTSQHFKK